MAKDDGIARAFLSKFNQNDHLAAINAYSLFELSRAPKILPKLDALFLNGHYNIWIPLLLDLLFDAELASYPNPPMMRWMPMSMIADDAQPNVMSKLANDPRFIRKREEHLRFGISDFMSLDRFKSNYPPDEDGFYTTRQAREFCTFNAMGFLGRYFPNFLLQFKDDASLFDSCRLPSIQMRSLLLFYKYYIYGQSPGASDFLDFAIASYVPYADFFVTERNVLNAMNHIKGTGLLPSATDFIHVNEFLNGVSA